MPHCTPETLRQILTSEGARDLAEKLIAESLPAIEIVRERVDDDALRPGASKLGGLPDLPPGVPWPRTGDRPLAFLAQIACAEVPQLEARPPENPALPAGGLLSIFYDVIEMPWGMYPQDRNGWVILYTPDTTNLVRLAAPAGAYDQKRKHDKPFNACAARYQAVTTYPDLDGAFYDRGPELYELYCETVHSGQGDEESPRHQMYGHPLTIQGGGMEEECQLVSSGFANESEMLRKAPARHAEMNAGVKDWMLLLQIDTDEEAGWMWGDVGILYFWIRRQDLAAKDFSNVWCILQCS